MKSRVLLVAAVLTMLTLVFAGTVSCRQESAGEQDGPDDTVQPLGEDEYRIEIAAVAVEIIAIVNGLDQMLAQPEMEDPDWTTTVTLAMEDITTLCNEAGRIVPPDSMADVHIVNLEAIDGLDSSIGMLAEGIDEQDIDLVNRAATEMWLAAEILAQVVDVSD